MQIIQSLQFLFKIPIAILSNWVNLWNNDFILHDNSYNSCRFVYDFSDHILGFNNTNIYLLFAIVLVLVCSLRNLMLRYLGN